jgi:hypothetical protein
LAQILIWAIFIGEKMKTLIALSIVSLFSLSAMAKSSLTASVEDVDFVSIRIVDDRYIPPFDAGNLWKMMNGYEYRKTLNEGDLQIDCVAFENELSDNIGDCLIKVNRKALSKVNTTYVLKYNGHQAARLNRYFVDNAYISIHNGKIFISSYNVRREFFLGIDETLVESRD